MPLTSAFTPCGMLALSSKPSQAETIYRSIVASLGGDGTNFAIQPGTREDATAYAQAMGLARERLTLQRAGNQMLPRKLSDLLPNREAEYGLVPGSKATMGERRAAVAAAKLLPLGAATAVVDAALKALLGTDYLGLRATPTAEAVTWPANIGDQPMNLQKPNVPRKIVRLTAGVSVLGSQSVAYASVLVATGGSSLPLPLFLGDVLVVDTGNNAQAERVTVTAVSTGHFTATFTKSHDAGAIATTGSFPLWASTKRHTLVALSSAAAVDPEKRRRVNALMAKMVRGISTWQITDGAAGSTLGPFKVGVGKLGVTTIGAVSYS